MIHVLFAVCSGQRTPDHPLSNFQEHGMQRIEANIKAARDSRQNAGYWTTRLLLRGSAYLCSFQNCLESAGVSVVCIGWPEHRRSSGGGLKAPASLHLTFLLVFLMNFDGPVANGGFQLLTSPTCWRSYE